jgi:hypothetical protein
MSIVLKDNNGEEITRLIDAQWILHIFEATHLDTQADRVQLTLTVDLWGCVTMGWIKNRLTEKYQDMKANGKMMATDDDQNKGRTNGKIDSDLSSDCDYDFPLNQARVLDWERHIHGH